MVVHVLNLPLDVAVNALAVGAVGELPDHAQPVRPLLPGKKLLHGYDDALTAPLPGNAHHLLSQRHLRRSRRSFFGFPPSSFQRSEATTRREFKRFRSCQHHWGLDDSQHEVTPLQLRLVQRAARQLRLVLSTDGFNLFQSRL